jgi:hypothetical protein
MIATSAPTMTHGLTAAERNAFARAIAGNLAATVRRLDRGLYEVPSTSDASVTYIVCGVQARDMTCTCVAGQRHRFCKHIAGVLLRRTQEDALRQARKLRQRVSQPSLPAQIAHQPLKRVELL